MFKALRPWWRPAPPVPREAREPIRFSADRWEWDTESRMEFEELKLLLERGEGRGPAADPPERTPEGSPSPP